VVPIGKVIARINTESNVANNINAPVNDASSKRTDHYEEANLVEEIPYQPSQKVAASNNNPGIRFYSPLVLNIASGEGISMSELEHIEGTGQDGRVSKKDIMTYLENRKTQPQQKHVERPVDTAVHDVPAAPEKQEYATPVTFTGNVEIIEMDRMRKMIARHMTDSKKISAHVTSFAECDVTNLVLWREKVKKEFEKREGEKITFTPLFIEGIIKCIKRYPLLNSSVDVDRIIVKKDINIGMATALPSGNLIVPVIKNADQLNLTGLTKQVNGLANAARTGKLKPDDTAGGTFTLTNVGTFGSIMGTPIINQPQVAIMAVGVIKKRPVVIETEQGDSIAIRHMMYISLSYDHRIIDGSLGSTFLNAVANEFENFDSKRSI
jgi:2-oxoglutarate dehydrogenase E2 component (dihydrolipoamide succinyltransferase)